MVIFVTKTSCPRREMTALALTVCAHIAATHYTPQFCAFDYRFLPFPNLTPNPPSAPPYASLVVEVMGRERGMALAVVSIASRVVEVMGRGMGMAPAVVSHASLVVEGMGRGMGMAPGLCLRPRRWWGQWEVSCAGPQWCRGQSARKPARTLAHSLATP